MDFLSNYGLFILKLASVVIGILIILALLFSMIARAREKNIGKLIIHKLNDKYKEYENILSHIIKNKSELKRFLKTQKKSKKKKAENQKRIFVINFLGDLRASAVCALREEITAILTVADKNDEVLVRVESAGGLVHAYGLAASQLQRIKDAHLKLTVAVDKIAASGGYMMACVANHIIAAPFAVVGSIGVLAQIPNFHRFLQKKSIDFEQLTAGQYKRTLTVFGENTEKDREKMQEEINQTHELFKAFIELHRPKLNVEKVATGEHWYATQAIDLNLVDKLQTSDDYLLAASKTTDLYELCYRFKKSFSKKLSQGATKAYDQLLGNRLSASGSDYL